MTTKITKAIFPVAGLGTRFLPATKALPKEMLPVVDKPLIQYAVEEAYAAGIREMIFVNGRNKRAIPDHFDTAYELETEMEAAGKTELLETVRSIKPDDMHCIYLRQPKALGLGHAVLCAEPVVREEPFAVLLADDLMVGEPPVLKQMVEQFREWRTSILAVQEVPAEHTKRYGIVSGRPVGDRMLDLTGIVGEIQLTDGIAGLLRREKVFAYTYQGQRYDCGSKEGFLQANVELALAHPTLGAEFKRYLDARYGVA